MSDQMSINYYVDPCPNPCPHCPTSRLHIGTVVVGYEFKFRAHPDEGIANRRRWSAAIQEAGQVCDENGQTMTPAEFEAMVDRTREQYGRPNLAAETVYLDPEGWVFDTEVSDE